MPTAPDRQPAGVVDLADAHDVPGVGPKSAVLSRLLRLGYPVPAGVVVLPHAGADEMGSAAAALAEILAVRSSAPDEDAAASSFAGVHESVLGVVADDVVAAVERVRASVASAVADAYRAARDAGAPSASAVLVQRQVDAAAAGVAFTVDPLTGADVVVVEAAAGLGDGVVGGTVDPDRYRVDPTGTVVRERSTGVLDDGAVRQIARLAREVAAELGGPQDLEWAVDGDGAVWLLQARPVTATASGPAVPVLIGDEPVLSGTGASRGRATGTARVLAGPHEHERFAPGDVLVCRTTDPAWVPLLTVAAAVVTEVGGLLAHAAIVARELGVPAVVGVPGATSRLAHEPVVTVDGDRGEVHPA
ncbi:hypothetical protein GCM10028777_00240 [Angustibacter speluncae]